MKEPGQILGTLPLRVDPAAGFPGAARLAEGSYPALARLQQDGTLLLLIGRHRLPAPNTLGLADGERLTVQLSRNQQGLTATVLQRQPPAEPPVAATLRQLLPAQGGVAAAVRSALANQTFQTALPQGAADALTDLLAAVPRPSDLTRPEGLRQTMRDSGSLLEWVLARVPGAAAQAGRRDFAALLLRLADRLRAGSPENPGPGGGPTPPGPDNSRPGAELAGQLEAAAARLRLLQLQPSQGGANLDLAFQIPVQHGSSVDELYLRIRREPDGDEGTDAQELRPLEVAVAFDFGDRGRLEARLRYQAGGLSATWWSEYPALRQAIDEGLPLLRERLEAAGLSVGRLDARAHPLAPMDGDVSRAQGGLLRETV